MNTQQQPNFTTASLYVGDLNEDVTEAHLFECFNPVGPVSSIRICRDAVTRRSLGYAYVNFHSNDSAERAIDTLNYTPIRGRSCRIMWSQRDPSRRKSGKGNVFIKNLHKDIDNRALYDTFSKIGTILSCKVALDEHGNSKGYGFVHFETDEAAQTAIDKVNGMSIADKQVFVQEFKSRRERGQGEKKFTNIFFKNVDPSVSDEEFQKEFLTGLEFNSFVIMKNENGESRGFGFCDFKEHEDAVKAIEKINKAVYKEKELFASRAMKKRERERELQALREARKQERISRYQGVNLYVKNLHEDIDDERLRKEFSPFGAITSCKVMRFENNNSRGFGFVCYGTPEEATKAIHEMNGKIVDKKPLYVAIHQRKEERARALQIQYQQRMAMRNKQQMQMGGMPYQYNRGGVYNAAPMIPNVRYPNPQQQPARQAYQGYPQGGNRQNRPQNRRPQQGQAPPANARQGAQARKPQQQGAATPAQSIDLADLSNLDPAAQKQYIGERIFPLVHSINAEVAGKVTGMLLELDNGELIALLEDPTALTEKINEAIQVLKDHQEKHKPEENASA